MVTMIIFVCFYLRIRIINSCGDETDLKSRNILLVTSEPSMTHSSDSGFSDPYNTNRFRIFRKAVGIGHLNSWPCLDKR